MAHDHDHGGPAPAFGEAARRHRILLSIALSISAVILIAEIAGTLLTGSLALLVDSGHMLTDVGGLTMALVASFLSTRPATSQRTWGYRRAEVLAATAQAAVLLAVGAFVIVEGIRRLFEPPEVPSGELLVFGVIGLVGNAASLLVLASSRRENFNLRAAFLEVLNDAIGSVAVIVAAVLIAVTGWGGADSLAALLIGALILPRAFRLLRETTNVLLESTPPGLDLDSVRDHILNVPDVREVHDLHAMQIATGLPVLTAHVIVEPESFENGRLPALLHKLQECVATHFEISVEHSTFQFEPPQHSQHEQRGHE
ncbi:cation transporter [Leifsonia xyli subsp. xyli]|uniref:Cobalt-zinc-cadmium efflux permease n=2 Tax=Leifsonia xyli subsp. xyli TaxID=59736 RepID=Q6AC20_LEIXX|nr:cation diffusion facilitator family transporter [Leifsonia xyli]AAT90072.1 cobalt-zinc-cadmium efflux permease [Leifsonia xyli subsp. xyli str. CTCB07]ODA89943.1 cation transporter [Leifsonia xyli subsp. xyli]